MLFGINDIERNTIILKTLKIAMLTYYTSFKIMNKKTVFRFKDNILIIFSGILCGIIRYYISYIISVISLIIMLSAILNKRNIDNSILTTIVSLGINYSVELIAIVISFGTNKIFGINNDYIKLIVITIVHLVLLYCIFKIKRFKNGILLLQKNTNNQYGDLLVLNTSIIILFSVLLIANSNIELTRILFCEIIIYAIIMYITIKKSLQLYYKQKLLVQDLNETKKELEEKKEEIKELENENLSFKKKSHSLIHQQKSLEYKIQEMLMQTEVSKEEVGEIKSKLEKIGTKIYKEKESIELSKTGISEIDNMLKYMQSECNKNKIELILQIKGNIHQMTNNYIEKEELEILLADHIKNAIIAINHTDNINRTIMVKLGKIESGYGISIYDSGAEFEKETLDNLGKKPSTTHADEGGTGMGFMNTFETLAKHKASLEIKEYNKPSKDNYTKVINIKFDKKNEFKIESYRR